MQQEGCEESRSYISRAYKSFTTRVLALSSMFRYDSAKAEGKTKPEYMSRHAYPKLSATEIRSNFSVSQITSRYKRKKNR